MISWSVPLDDSLRAELITIAVQPKECSQADTYQNVNKYYRRHLMVEGDYLNAISEGLDVLKSSAWVKTSFRVCRSLYLNISSCRLVVIVDIVLPYI